MPAPIPTGADAYYAGAVPRVSAFLHNGTLDFPGFRRALTRAGELAQGHFVLAPAVARATAGWPPLEPYAEEATRLHVLELVAGSLGQAAQEASSLATVHAGAARDLAAARQLIITLSTAIQEELQSTLPPPRPVDEVLRRYATARAQWVAATKATSTVTKKDIKIDKLAPARAEVNAACAKDALVAVRAEVQQAQQAIASALAAVRLVAPTNPVSRAEQDAWVAALGGAIPRSIT